MTEDFVYAIVGPTAVGKTKISFDLAREIGGEIVSVDSRQVYRYLDVGTDKISPADRKIVPHHMIDIADPDEVFTAADFVAGASSAIRRVRDRGKVPILAGGSPMYYKALEGSLITESLPRDDAVRRELELTAEADGTEALHHRLREIDPASARKIHPNDKLRIVRSLEIYKLTNRPASEIYATRSKIGGDCGIAYFGVDTPRDLLYRRIERRAEEQFHSGYPEEVKWLLDNGYSRDLPALRGFGYRELIMFLDGKVTFDEALAGDIKSTKAFSRRQATWFRQFSPILWYDLSEVSMEKIIEDMKEKIISKVRDFKKGPAAG